MIDDFANQMQAWADANGVKPLKRRDTLQDASQQAFGRHLDDYDRRTFYALWAQYDHNAESFSLAQQARERLGELAELERMFQL